MIDHERFMREAMNEAEKARGGTGDNPWVGCVIVDAAGNLVSRGYTRGPGEDHAEIGALRAARGLAVDLSFGYLYSTLEPCSFHGRTPACAKVVAECGIGTLVYAIRDPHPKVSGAGAKIVEEGGVSVIEGVLAADVRLQLAPWVFDHHPHEPEHHARTLLEAGSTVELCVIHMMERYGLPRGEIAELVERVARG